MKGWQNICLASVAVLSMCFTAEAKAADLGPAPETSDWVFTGAAYLWATGLDGKAGLFGFPPQDVSLSAGDVIGKLDGAVMAAGELRHGPFSIGLDVAYARLSTNVGTPFGIAANNIDISADTFMGTTVLGYSMLDTGTANVDLVAGARLWSVNTHFDFNGGLLDGRRLGDGATWLDPVVGAKFRANITDRAYLSGWGLVGGFGAGSDLMWDVMGGLGYDISRSFSLFAGYRAVSVDYRNNGFVYDIVQQGPIFAGVVRF